MIFFIVRERDLLYLSEANRNLACKRNKHTAVMANILYLSVMTNSPPWYACQRFTTTVMGNRAPVLFNYGIKMAVTVLYFIPLVSTQAGAWKALKITQPFRFNLGFLMEPKAADHRAPPNHASPWKLRYSLTLAKRPESYFEHFELQI